MKTITAIFTSIGKRRKLLGFEAYLDGTYIGQYATRDDALAALDKIMFEQLVMA